MKSLSKRINIIFFVGIVAAVAYIFFEMVRLPSDLKRQLSPLSPLAQQIGGLCYIEGDGDWIQGIVKTNSESAVSAALSELIGLSDAKVSGCAESHARVLALAKGPVLK